MPTTTVLLQEQLRASCECLMCFSNNALQKIRMCRVLRLKFVSSGWFLQPMMPEASADQTRHSLGGGGVRRPGGSSSASTGASMSTTAKTTVMMEVVVKSQQQSESLACG